MKNKGIVQTIKSFEKRSKIIEIAKDALEQLKLKRIIANQGDYVEYYCAKYGECKFLTYDDENEFRGKEIQDLIKENKITKCSVCAVGSLFISFVNKFNNVKFKHNGEDFDSCFVKTVDVA